MRYFTLLLLLTLFATNSVDASSLPEDYADKTFFTKNKLERIYFDNDGSFTQQLEQNWERIPAGNFIKGLWSIKDDQLCLMYTSNLSIQNQNICMNVTKDKRDLIARISDDENSPAVFTWGRSLDGNYLLKENFLYPEARTKDQDIVDYLVGKVIQINEKEYIYFESEHKAYLTSPFVEEISWTILNNLIRYQYWDDGALKDSIIKVTLGDEFYQEDRKGRLYLSPIPHFIHIEGDGIELHSFDEFYDKQMFLDYIDRATKQP